jgi:hypothetical protein
MDAALYALQSESVVGVEIRKTPEDMPRQIAYS